MKSSYNKSLIKGYSFLSLIMFMFFLNSEKATGQQYTYNFSTAATLSGNIGPTWPWNTTAQVTINGISYTLTAGGNGSWTNETSGGESNSACIKKEGSGGDELTIKRTDGAAFQIYGLWLKHSSMNTAPYGPPYYKIYFRNGGTDLKTYTINTQNSSDTYSENLTVTTVYISFSSLLTYHVDNLIVGPCPPTVTTNAINQFSNSSALMGCNVTGDGGSSITERGIVYNTTGTPTTADTKILMGGTSTGSFSQTISGLSASTLYYIRSFASNSIGTSYGTQVTFTTAGPFTLVGTHGFNTAWVSTTTQLAPFTKYVEGWDVTATSTGTGNVSISRITGTSSGEGLASVRATSATTAEDLVYMGVKANDGSSFDLESFKFRYGTKLTNTSFNKITVTGYKGGTAVSGAAATLTGIAQIVGASAYTLFDVSANNNFNNIDEFRITASEPVSSGRLSIIDLDVLVIQSATAATTAPTVTTTAPASVTSSAATLGGNVTADGGATVSDRGVVYNTTGTPTTSDTKVSIGTGTGTFSQSATGLTQGTTYYVRAYALNSVGTSYGSEESFTTLIPDVTAPTVSSIDRKTPSGATTNSASVVYKITFSEAVSGVDISDFTLTSTGSSTGTIASVSASSGATIDVTINSISGDGTLGLNLKATGTGITDGASNAITGGLTGQTYTFDFTIPTVTKIERQSPTAEFTNATSVTYLISFSESVSGIDIADFTLTATGTAAGTIASVSASSGTAIEIVVNSVSGDGTLRLDLKSTGTAIADGAANAVAGGFTSGQSYTLDHSLPSVSSINRMTPSNGSTNATSVIYKITFSESVSGIDIGDFTLTKTGTATGTIASVSASSGSTAEVTVNSLSGDGTLRLDLKSSATGIIDGVSNAINGGFTAGQTYTLDKTAPAAPSITGITTDSGLSTSDGITNDNTLKISGTAEASTTVSVTEVGVGVIGTATADGSGAWTLDFTGTTLTAGNHTFTATATDAVNNTSPSSTDFKVIVDTTSPTVTLSSTASNPTNVNPIPVKVDFSETVTGFDLTDITVTGGTKGNFSGSGKNYTFDITPSADGAITANIAGSAAQDEAGNNSTAATQFSVTFVTAPTVTISSTSVSPTNSHLIALKIEFSASVTGFEINDITVSGGTKSNFSGSGKSYTMDITPTATGTITADIAAGVAIDVVSNGNVAASQFSITYDGIAPSVSISSTKSNPTNASVIPVKIEFSENVTGFDITDIAVSGGTTGNFAGSGKNYSVNVTPAANGSITVDVAGSVAKDGAENNNSAATQFSIVYDNTKPSVTISSIKSSITHSNPIPVKIDFSENVTGFDLDDISVSGGTKGNFGGSQKNYTFDVTPSADGTITVNIATNVAQDAAGNASTAANAFSIDYASCATTAITTQPVGHTICNGANTDFSVAATGTELSYQWQVNAANGFINVTDNNLYQGSKTATLSLTNADSSLNGYQYKVIVFNVCNQDLASSTVQLNIPQITAPQVVSGSNCGPGKVVLKATGSTDGNYRWYFTANSVTPISGEANGTYTTPSLTATTTFYVAVSNGTCESRRIAVTAKINSIPEIPTINEMEQDIILTLTSSSNTGNQWYRNGQLIAGAIGKTLQLHEGGSYSVKVTNEDGCSVVSDATVLTNINEEHADNLIKVYPNPVQNKLTVTHASGKQGDIKIYDMAGKLIKSAKINSSSSVLDLSACKTGIYTMEVLSGGNKSIIKIIKN